MNAFSPAEITGNYALAGAAKTASPAGRTLALGVWGGYMIGMGGAAAITAAHALANPSAASLAAGLIFPFGLCMVALLGAELFTGNCLMVISVLERKSTLRGMLSNWLLVYVSNGAGAMLLAAAFVYSGSLNHGGGALAVHAIRMAAAKCSLEFGEAVVLGIACNLLVCIGVLCSLSAKCASGKIQGAYIPVALFVICGFEHSVANLFFIPAGLLALSAPEYARMAAEAGVNLQALSWTGFALRNLLPVTLGNIIGGVGIGMMMWACHRPPRKPAET